MWPIYPHTNTHMHDRTMHWDTLTAIECPYNTVEFVTILRWQWLNINEPLASHKDTHISTWRASHGVSIARIWEKIDRIRTISHDNIRTHENYDASPLQNHAHLADGVPKCAGVSILITDITWDGKKTILPGKGWLLLTLDTPQMLDNLISYHETSECVHQMT